MNDSIDTLDGFIEGSRSGNVLNDGKFQIVRVVFESVAKIRGFVLTANCSTDLESSSN